MVSRTEDQVRNRALDHVNLATARLQRRELDGMVDEATNALSLAASLKSRPRRGVALSGSIVESPVLRAR